MQDDLQAADPADRAVELASFLRIGSWIGGDRDGNPFVTAEVLGETLRMRVRAHAVFILTSFMSSALSYRSATRSLGVSPELRELAGRSPDRSRKPSTLTGARSTASSGATIAIASGRGVGAASSRGYPIVELARAVDFQVPALAERGSMSVLPRVPFT